MGLIIDADVHSASVQDRDAALDLFVQAKKKIPTLQKFFADQGYSYQTSLLGRQIEYTINSLKPPFIGGKHSFSFVSLLLRIGIRCFAK